MLQPKNSKSQPSHVVPPPLSPLFVLLTSSQRISLICSTYFVSKEMDSGPHKTPSRPELDLARYFSIKLSKIYSTRSTRNLFFLYNLNGVIFFCRNMIEEYILIIAQDFVRKLLRLFFRENNDGNTWIASNQQENYIFHRKR